MADASPRVIGIVGTGQLGRVFTDRFVGAGYDVFAYDVDAVALNGLDPRVVRCVSPAEVADSAPTVITCVTGPAAVRECILGERGILASTTAETLVIDTTSSLPAMTRLVGDHLNAAGGAIVDAPVSRGLPAAVEGTMSIWMGGDEGAVERATPYLRSLGTDILHVGPLGCGHAVKAVNMMLMAVNLVATAEVMTIAKSYGIEIDTMLAVLNASSGGNFLTRVHFPKYVQTGSFDSKFTLSLMQKDLHLARQLAEDADLATPFGDRALGLYRLCRADPDFRRDGDNTLIVAYIDKLLGTQAIIGGATA